MLTQCFLQTNMFFEFVSFLTVKKKIWKSSNADRDDANGKLETDVIRIIVLASTTGLPVYGNGGLTLELRRHMKLLSSD